MVARRKIRKKAPAKKTARKKPTRVAGLFGMGGSPKKAPKRPTKKAPKGALGTGMAEKAAEAIRRRKKYLEDI